MAVNPTYRRIIAAGPKDEIAWFVEHVRGGWIQRNSGQSAWKERLQFSFTALAHLLPRANRPTDFSPGIGTTDVVELWESSGGMQAARWDFTDDWRDALDGLEQVLVALTARYRAVCWVSAAEEPDTLTASSGFYAKGRATHHSIEGAHTERIVEEVYRRAGVDGETADENEDSYAMELCDRALLDRAEAFWDRKVAAFIGICTPNARDAVRPGRSRRVEST
jgi:hypothetical protein